MLIVNLYKKIILLLVCCTLFLSSCRSSDETGPDDSVSAGQPTLAVEIPDIEAVRVRPQFEAVEEEVMISRRVSDTTELFRGSSAVNEPEQVSIVAKSVGAKDADLTPEGLIGDLSADEQEVGAIRNTTIETTNLTKDAIDMELSSEIEPDDPGQLFRGSFECQNAVPLSDPNAAGLYGLPFLSWNIVGRTPNVSPLVDPIAHEAQECSNNIIYTGVTPDQQIKPTIDFMYKHSPAAGGNVFLIGSDDVFPRILNTITNAQVKQLGGTVVGEDYLPLGNTEVAPIISKIKKALPEGGIIINTLNGDQNVAFFKQMQEAGITPSSGYYAMNYSIAQEEISTIGPKYLEGHYGVWNYTTSIDTPKNDGFSRVGQPISPEEISTIGPEFIEDELAISDEGFPATATRQLRAGGTGSAQNVLAEVIPNHHLSQTVIIGEINAEGGITILKKTEVVLPQALDPELERLTRFSCAQTDGGQETEGWLGVSGLLFPKIVPDGREFLQPERMEPSIADTTPSNQLGVGLSYKEACAYNGRVEIISSPLATASDPIPIEEKVRICSTVNQLEIYCVLEGEKKRKLKDYTEELQKTIAELGVELKTRNKVSVTFDIDEDGMLEVTSQNKSLGEKINVKAKCDETIEDLEELGDETTGRIPDAICLNAIDSSSRNVIGRGGSSEVESDDQRDPRAK